MLRSHHGRGVGFKGPRGALLRRPKSVYSEVHIGRACERSSWRLECGHLDGQRRQQRAGRDGRAINGTVPTELLKTVRRAASVGHVV